ncbi:eCIS core domain-containing protein [Nostoc sp.]|uniref:eCIS core domain-containing protein n=1 Tax=Nostoc sp. TaxID=1180 RepID=UPI002FF6141B
MSDVQRQAALRPGIVGRQKADTSTSPNPSLALPSTPTLANPIRGFGVETVTEASPDLQKAQSADEQLVEPEAIKQSPLSHDISRMSLRPQKAFNEGVMNTSKNAVIQGSGIKNASYGVDVVSPSGGQNLPEPVLAKMQTAFNTNLSNVKIHTDGQAEKLGSQAFASGNNLHFTQGKYDPNSQSGQALIGHELTHVVQQRQGRVNIPQLPQDGNSIVVQDQALETEADVLGSKAAASSDVDSKQSIQAQKIDGTVSNAVQQKPIVQNALPVIGSVAAWGASLATESAAAAATVTAATIQGLQAAAQVGGALAPGQSGVQSVQLDNGYMSPVDKQKLQLITQYRLINAYVSHWKRQHPDVPLAPPAQGTAPTPATPATPTPTPATPAPAAQDSPNQSGGTLDQAILEAVKAEVQLQIETLLNTNQKTLTNVEYIWSDSGDHTADSIGTVGSVEFSNVKGTFIKETLQLSSDAAQIPNLDPPSRGQEMDVRQFRGGSMRRGSSMSIGYGDSLSINLTGSGPTIDHAGNFGHGEHTYSTDWNWDGNTTQGDFPLYILPDGKPTFATPRWRGEPDDNSYF